MTVLALFDRVPKHAAEAFRIAKQAWHQERELRPQLAQMVLDRRTGQAQAMAASSRHTNCVALAATFLIACESSSTAICHAIGSSRSASRGSSA